MDDIWFKSRFPPWDLWIVMSWNSWEKENYFENQKWNLKTECKIFNFYSCFPPWDLREVETVEKRKIVWRINQLWGVRGSIILKTDTCGNKFLSVPLISNLVKHTNHTSHHWSDWDHLTGAWARHRLLCWHRKCWAVPPGQFATSQSYNCDKANIVC